MNPHVGGIDGRVSVSREFEVGLGVPGNLRYSSVHDRPKSAIEPTINKNPTNTENRSRNPKRICSPNEVILPSDSTKFIQSEINSSLVDPVDLSRRNRDGFEHCSEPNSYVSFSVDVDNISLLSGESPYKHGYFGEKITDYEFRNDFFDSLSIHDETQNGHDTSQSSNGSNRNRVEPRTPSSPSGGTERTTLRETISEQVVFGSPNKKANTEPHRLADEYHNAKQLSNDISSIPGRVSVSQKPISLILHEEVDTSSVTPRGHASEIPRNLPIPPSNPSMFMDSSTNRSSPTNPHLPSTITSGSYSRGVKGRVSFAQDVAVSELEKPRCYGTDQENPKARKLECLQPNKNAKLVQCSTEVSLGSLNTVLKEKSLTPISPKGSKIDENLKTNSNVTPNPIGNASKIKGRVSLMEKSNASENVDYAHKIGSCRSVTSQQLQTPDETNGFRVNPHFPTELNNSLKTGNIVSYSLKTGSRELKGALQRDCDTLGFFVGNNTSIRENTESSTFEVQNTGGALPKIDCQNVVAGDLIYSTKSTKKQLIDRSQQTETDTSYNKRDTLRADRDLEDLNSPRYHLRPDVNHNVTDHNPPVTKVDENHNVYRQQISPYPPTVPDVNHVSPSHSRKPVRLDLLCDRSYVEICQETRRKLEPKIHLSPSGHLQTTEFIQNPQKLSNNSDVSLPPDFDRKISTEVGQNLPIELRPDSRYFLSQNNNETRTYQPRKNVINPHAIPEKVHHESPSVLQKVDVFHGLSCSQCVSSVSLPCSPRNSNRQQSPNGRSQVAEIRRNSSPNPHAVPQKVNCNPPSPSRSMKVHAVRENVNEKSTTHSRKADEFHDSCYGQCANTEPSPHSPNNGKTHSPIRRCSQQANEYHDSLSGPFADTESSPNPYYRPSPKGRLHATEVYHDSFGGSTRTEDMNLSLLSGYERKMRVDDGRSNEYQNAHPAGSSVHQDLNTKPIKTSILKNSKDTKNYYQAESLIPLQGTQMSGNPSKSSSFRMRHPPYRPQTSKNPGNRNPHAVLPSISPKPHSEPNRPKSSYTPRLNQRSSFPPVSDKTRYGRSVMWDILSEGTEEGYSLYSYSTDTGSYSDDSSRCGSGRRREETKRQRYWNWTQPGLTVDELARHRRKRPPSSQKPKDSLKVLDGSFAHLKTEYRRRYRRNSSLLKSLEKLKPEDLLKLEGELKCSAAYNEEFVEHPIQREKPLRRPTSLKLEGALETSTEVQEKFKYEEAEKSALIKQEASLKPEGELLVKVSEVHDKYVEFPGVKRPELTRKPTSLKLEGPIETSTEVGDKFVQHPPQPLEKPIVHDAELSSATSPMAHEVTTEYRPEYKENYIAFEAKRPVVKKPEGSLKPEGTIEASTELKSEFKDFHPSRPVLHRNNSLLKPSGEFTGESEKRSEFRDFHPARPTIHRNNSLLKPSGEFESATEKGSEFRDFHPSRPVLQRNNSQLRPSGDMAKTSEVRAEYKNFNPKRPVIHRVDSKLKPEGEMAKTTEVKSEYRDFHPSRPVLHRTPSHLAMEGQMEKESEIRAEYRDFHPSRPVIYRKNSLLKPEGDIEASTEVRSEYKDFHPSRPTIHRNNSLLKPEGDIGKESEVRSEYKDFHPGRPIIHRKNSMLHPEGDFAKDTEIRSEYKDFHPTRPIIHRKNSMLHPEGDFSNDTEIRSEYKDFHPSRPTIHRNNSLLRPEGDLMNTDSELKHEYKDHKPKRPTIYTENCNLKPGNRIEERTRALTPKSREYYVLEGEITIRPERSGGRTLENIKNEERTSTAGRRSETSLSDIAAPKLPKVTG